jgi:signal transduction histidine kinase
MITLNDSVLEANETIAPETVHRKTGLRYGEYEYPETLELVKLVEDAAELLKQKGEDAFLEFRQTESRWRKGESYIFILDPKGNMLVHPDAELEGKNQMELKDVNGKPIIRGLIETVTTFPEKTEGWFHYQWSVPGDLMPRWKSSFVKLVKTDADKTFILGSGIYNDRMERVFVVDAVEEAVRRIEKMGEAAFPMFHDPTGPFLVKDAYVFVIDPACVELVNAGFPNFEGQNVSDVKDANGKFLNREMLQIVETTGYGWVDYMWPKPGDSVSTKKSAYVSRASLGDSWVLVGCGVYLADAPKALKVEKKMSARELETFVREAADILEQEGENAYRKFRSKGSKWFADNTYLFVFTMDGKRAFHAAEPETEGRDDRELKDMAGRPIVKMILDAASTALGEGWVHYMYPEPGNIFPVWKSTFVKRVTFPSGSEYIVGCGIYNMQMDKVFIEDLVNRAGALIAEHGREAFPLFRDQKGPFWFMDTYIFVETPNGTELVNPAQPLLEGRNLMLLKDVKGKEVIREEVEAAMSEGSAWLGCYWYKPGDNKPAPKLTFVRKVQHDGATYIVGSGFYSEATGSEQGGKEVQKISWQNVEKEKMSDSISRQWVCGQKATISKFFVTSGGTCARHFHESEEFCFILSGSLKFQFDDREQIVEAGEALVIPSNVPHSVMALDDAEFVDFFAPLREDWLTDEDQYLRSSEK